MFTLVKKIASLLLILIAFAATNLVAKDAASWFKNPEKSDLELKSAGKIAFGPDGMLLISDPRSASVVAVDSGDSGPIQKLSTRVDDIESALAEATGSKGITIIDMAVNPLSGKVYFSVNGNPGNIPHIAVLAADGSLSSLALDDKSYVRVSLPTSENAQLRNVTDLAWGKDSIVVAGQSSEEFANKIYQIPSPLEHGENADFFSAETYHVAHRRWETKAPIQSFIPWEEDGDFYLVCAFACTPIPKLPIGDLYTGTMLRETTVV